MTRSYIVTADRTTTVLYFAWEFGVANAVRFSKKQVQGQHIINPITGLASPRPCKTKREAESLARRVREACAYMQGRLGRVSHGSTVTVQAFREDK